MSTAVDENGNSTLVAASGDDVASSSSAVVVGEYVGYRELSDVNGMVVVAAVTDDVESSFAVVASVAGMDMTAAEEVDDDNDDM